MPNSRKNIFASEHTLYTLTYRVGISPEEAFQFDEGSLGFKVSGMFSHLEKIGDKEIVQPFGGWLECGRIGDGERGAAFHWEIHMNPAKIQADEKSGNGQSAT